MPSAVFGVNNEYHGRAILDFGDGTQDQSEASVVVAAQSIPSVCYSIAWLGDGSIMSTPENDKDAHLIAASLIRLIVGAFVKGVGFTVHGYTDGDVTGRFEVMWSWVGG